MAYSQEVGDRICADLAKGMTLRQVCRQEGMPSHSTVIQWALDDVGPGFADQYARARQVGYMVMAEDLTEIADDGVNDWMEVETGKQPDHEHIQRSKLRVDTRKWLLSKALPKVYGDKLQTQALGADGNPADPPKPVINVTVSK